MGLKKLKQGLIGFFSFSLNLQIIILQCVRGYKQKTPRMWGLMHEHNSILAVSSYLPV